MKKFSVLAVSAVWSLAAFSINLNDGVLTLTGGTMSALTEELAAITGGQVTKIVISSSGVRLYVCGGEIDKPIHFMAAYSSGDGQLYMSSTTTTFKRKVTIEDNFKIFFGGSGTIYCDGGLVHKKGTITDAGASGTWYVRNVPVQINAVELTWQPLRLQVAGNAIKKVSLSSGGRLILEADDALSGWRTALVSAQSERLDSTYVQLNGHGAAIGDLNFTYAVPIHAGAAARRFPSPTTRTASSRRRAAATSPTAPCPS